MKATASKWPITVTIELAEDYFEGLEEGVINKEEFKNASEIQTLADTWSKLFIQAKVQALVMQEAKAKENRE